MSKNLNIKITQDNVPHAYIYGDIEFTMPALYFSKDDENGVTHYDSPAVYLTEDDVIKRLAGGSEYNIYLLCSVFENKCTNKRDEDNITAYATAFETTTKDFLSMDSDIRAMEMIIRLTLGKDVRFW